MDLCSIPPNTNAQWNFLLALELMHQRLFERTLIADKGSYVSCWGSQHR